ncbi:DeoR family transcriptional regulator of aga operon [Okibacterium sp. HSC-33S16]|uniref:DeoR/GlpR family DNA-binding transcription regulator n=1 Tax=Okibacterium sp. HSC-33S16 TaxID=2910965 RepID=UPI00209FFF91|nr:DeoR/GlpR family DNA-binding transcription regulator [Okibacterium sp. HSC-33S16]MCP2030128.1 DeoR family transcriptional regulator of aga operon [Okibacterium sp. HSC-33S16]
MTDFPLAPARGQGDAMPAVVRRERMADLIAARGFLKVSDLSETFGVSEVTVRSDLAALDDGNAIRRVHGGAVPRGQRVREASFETSLEASALAKQAIGSRAAALVSSGQSVLLDVGTTALAVAQALADRADLEDLVIITNGLNIALELEAQIPRFTIIVTGGALRPLQHSLVHPLARTVLEQVHADIAFIGCNGVDAVAGVTNVNLPEAEVKQLMVSSADRVVVLADASKLGQVSLGSVCGIESVDVLLTNEGADATVLADLAAGGVEVVIA